MSIEFRQLTKEKEGQQFQLLHNFLFKNTAVSTEWLRWYFDKLGSLHDDRYSRVYGAFDGDKMVGCWCVEPKKLQVVTEENKFIVDVQSDKAPTIIDVGRCFAVGIHPDYQRRGLFIQLSTFAIDAERALGDYMYIVGFPQRGKAVIGGHLKAGWELTHRIRMMSWKTHHPALVSLQHVNKVTNFSQVKTSFPIGVTTFIESADYRNLRWLKHPDHSYICLSKDDSYIVLKPYGDSCHILDVQGNSANVVLLLAAAKSLAVRHNWKELTSWCSDNELLALEITSSGFRDGSERGLSVELMSVRITAKHELVIPGYVHFGQGVEEVY